MNRPPTPFYPPSDTSEGGKTFKHNEHEEENEGALVRVSQSLEAHANPTTGDNRVELNQNPMSVATSSIITITNCDLKHSTIECRTNHPFSKRAAASGSTIVTLTTTTVNDCHVLAVSSKEVAINNENKDVPAKEPSPAPPPASSPALSPSSAPESIKESEEASTQSSTNTSTPVKRAVSDDSESESDVSEQQVFYKKVKLDDIVDKDYQSDVDEDYDMPDADAASQNSLSSDSSPCSSVTDDSYGDINDKNIQRSHPIN
ncbi:hypothetical protein BC940DRAFT_343972 [Gongronella butleri]|nr:hypothetical protein BC940DRAFT_343972 [Gongronella butleri]